MALNDNGHWGASRHSAGLTHPCREISPVIRLLPTLIRLPWAIGGGHRIFPKPCGLLGLQLRSLTSGPAAILQWRILHGTDVNCSIRGNGVKNIFVQIIRANVRCLVPRPPPRTLSRSGGEQAPPQGRKDAHVGVASPGCRMHPLYLYVQYKHQLLQAYCAARDEPCLQASWGPRMVRESGPLSLV